MWATHQASSVGQTDSRLWGGPVLLPESTGRHTWGEKHHHEKKAASCCEDQDTSLSRCGSGARVERQRMQSDQPGAERERVFPVGELPCARAQRWGRLRILSMGAPGRLCWKESRRGRQRRIKQLEMLELCPVLSLKGKAGVDRTPWGTPGSSFLGPSKIPYHNGTPTSRAVKLIKGSLV